MKTLLIMRHAKSAYPPDVAEDFGRPLNKRGEADAPRMGRVLAACGARPDAIVASAARRATETAQAVAAALDRPAADVQTDDRLYQASVETLNLVTAAVPDAVAALLVVAHNPGMEQWLEAVSGANTRLPTAAVAAVELPLSRWLDIGRVRGQLQWLVVPKLVRRLGC